MAVLVTAIHAAALHGSHRMTADSRHSTALGLRLGVDARDKRGHDGASVAKKKSAPREKERGAENVDQISADI